MFRSIIAFFDLSRFMNLSQKISIYPNVFLSINNSIIFDLSLNFIRSISIFRFISLFFNLTHFFISLCSIYINIFRSISILFDQSEYFMGQSPTIYMDHHTYFGSPPDSVGGNCLISVFFDVTIFFDLPSSRKLVCQIISWICNFRNH